jgi:Pro-kumamolisin, activation domain/Bacterial Ig-like domain (group 3)
MKRKQWHGRLVLLVVAAAAVFGLSSAHAGAIRRAAAKQKLLPGDTPAAVAHGNAQLRGRHDPNAVFRVNVGLGVRNSAGLDALIRAASTPGSPRYGHYLTQAQYLARYAPTDAEVAAVKSWLRSQGLSVLNSSATNLIVHAKGPVKTLQRAFGVTINNYVRNGRAFHANDRDPTVPAGLDVHWISGLSNFNVYKPFHVDTCEVNPPNKCGYDGSTFDQAYDVVGNGSGQTLGLTLWGAPLPQADYDNYATATGTTKIVVDNNSGDNHLNFIPVDGTSSDTSGDAEVALDTQIAHGMADGLHMDYWLGSDNSDGTLEDTLQAAESSGIKVISNSWGCDGCSTDSNMDSILQAGAATGQTFYFATGDNGASVGRSRPADSPYVVAVGGTQLNIDGSGNWSSETGSSGSGGGCDNGETRPPWQVGISGELVYPSSSCTGRAEPDVAANMDIGTFLWYDGAERCCIGGTSLATPIWAAATVIYNKHNAATGRPGVGFDAPVIYGLANDPTTYARDFHDITSGNNGFAAGTGWDEDTGWGSADFDKLFNNPVDITYTGPTTASNGDTITLSATMFDQGASTPVVGRTIDFAAGFDTCSGVTDSSGDASCTITVSSAPGTYQAIAAFAGDAAYVGNSDTKTFTVLHIPTKITYTGDTSGEYNDPVTLSARLNDDSGAGSFSSGDPLSGKTLDFTLGAESCSGVTDGSGVASCSVTPLDNPGGYSAGVSFAGDSTYNSSSSSTPFTLNQEESAITYNGPLTSHYHDSLTATATLIDPDGGAPIPGKAVTFTLGVGDTCSATTDASGVASCTITPTQTGTQIVVASFAGDIDYLASSDAKSFSITPEETTMKYTGPTFILAGASGATLTATMVEDGANDNDGDDTSVAPNPAESVTLSIGSQQCTGTTDSAGNVTCTIPSVTVPLGPETVGASFAGDAFYQPSHDSTTAIVFAFPSRGAFALGDVTAAPPYPSPKVTWWDNTWSQLNALSGGSAPSAFKGFLGAVTLPTQTPANICSSPWTTTGGNSPPPTTGVPSYMGVVVTSNVNKSGSTLSGNYSHIVVVHINPGYAPNPGSPGTGTILGKFC